MIPLRTTLQTIAEQLHANADAGCSITPPDARDLADPLSRVAAALWQPESPPEPTAQAMRYWACRMVGWAVFVGRGASPDPEDIRAAATLLFGAARGMDRVPELRVVKS